MGASSSSDDRKHIITHICCRPPPDDHHDDDVMSLSTTKYFRSLSHIALVNFALVVIYLTTIEVLSMVQQFLGQTSR